MIAINANYVETATGTTNTVLTNLKKMSKIVSMRAGKVVKFTSCKYVFNPEQSPKITGIHPVIISLQKTVKDFEIQLQQQQKFLNYLIIKEVNESRGMQ